MQILDIPEGKKGIMASGYTCMMHFHTIIDEVSIDVEMETLDNLFDMQPQLDFIKISLHVKCMFSPF